MLDEYRRCGHVVFEHREKCRTYRRYGECDEERDDYLDGGGTCPPCFRRRLARGVDSSLKYFFGSGRK